MIGPPPIPTAWLPEGRTLVLDGRGEVFFRDSGPDTARQGTLLLLHGWTVTADLNWALAFRPLVDAGYRVIALDHRGHGRGMRQPWPFRLADCAADAAQLLVQLDAAPATVVGYSMGGAIAQLMARDHAAVCTGVVLCATSTHWNSRREAGLRFGMGFFNWMLRLFPGRFWRSLVRWAGRPDPERDAWALGELSRNSPESLAEAGRELGRFDSRGWIGSLDVGVAVIVTGRDQLIPAERQRAMATIAGAKAYEVGADHGAVVLMNSEMIPAILEAVGDVRSLGSRPSPALSPAG